MNPKISVVIPTYNRPNQVKKAIESVLNQTYKDYEIIVIDDGSTDDTKNIIVDLISVEKKIKYIYQSNQGRSAARNTGIKNSAGKYISFLDSDDLFLPEKLEVQVFEMENQESMGMSFTWTYLMDELGNIICTDENSKYLSGSIYPKILFIRNNIIMTPTVMVRKSVIENIGNFKETLSMCEDLDLWRRISIKYPILQIQKSLSIICIRKNEPPNYDYLFQARKKYYEIALAEDNLLNKKYRNELFSEMYAYYGINSLRHDFSWGLQAITKSFFLSPKYFFIQAIDKMISIGALFLKKLFTVEKYNQIKSFYHQLLKNI